VHHKDSIPLLALLVLLLLPCTQGVYVSLCSNKHLRLNG
jgi:hypothetical protein